MKYTLLEMVQRVLSAMDSDEVNSISDTTESNQVALLIEGVYNDLLAECNFPELGTLFELNASGDNTKPTLMTIPEEISNVEWVKYDVQTEDETLANYQPVAFRCLQEFLSHTNSFRTFDNVGVLEHSITNGVNTDNIPFYYRSDQGPSIYTSFDDGTLIFDSYDSDVDTTLQKTKTQCRGSIIPTFSLTDTFTPRLDSAQFSLLMNEAKARAFVELKQANNTNAEGHARRLKIRLRNSKHKASPHSIALPNYGRK
jgi:hypothetical protein